MINFKKTKFQKFLHLTTLNLSAFQYPGMVVGITGAATALSMFALATHKELFWTDRIGISVVSGIITGILAPFVYLIGDGLTKEVWNKIDKHNEIRGHFFNDSFYLNKLYHILKDIPTDLKNIAVEQHETYLYEKKAQIFILSRIPLLANSSSIEYFKINHEPLIRALTQNLNVSEPLLETQDVQKQLNDPGLQAALKKELLAQKIDLIDLFENMVLQQKNKQLKKGYLYSLESNWLPEISNTLMVLCLQTQTLTTEQTKEMCVLLEKIKDPSKVEEVLSLLIETSTSAHNMDFQILSKFLKSSLKVNPIVAHTLQEKINILQASSGQSSQALMDIQENEPLSPSSKAIHSPTNNGKSLFEPGILAVLRGAEIYNLCEKQSSTPGSKEIKENLLYLRQELEFFEQNKSLFSMENAVELKLIVNRNLPALLHYLQTSDKLSEDLRPQLLAGITKTLGLVRSNVEKLKDTMGNNMLAELEVMSTHMENKKKSLTAHRG